jgi:hypothetical protein
VSTVYTRHHGRVFTAWCYLFADLSLKAAPWTWEVVLAWVQAPRSRGCCLLTLVEQMHTLHFSRPSETLRRTSRLCMPEESPCGPKGTPRWPSYCQRPWWAAQVKSGVSSICNLTSVSCSEKNCPPHQKKKKKICSSPNFWHFGNKTSLLSFTFCSWLPAWK